MCLHSLNPYLAGPLGCLPQRTAPTNPTYRPQRQNSKPVPPNGATQNFPPWNQPLPVGLVDAAASGSVPAFPAGGLDWLVAFLQQIMSPEDYQKYKSSFEPSLAKEEVPLAVQLANKTKERGTVMGRIEHYRNVCRDLETKLMKQSKLLDAAVERKATLQNEINELEVRIAEEEARIQGLRLDLPQRCRRSFPLLLKKKMRMTRRWKVKPPILGLVLVPSCRLPRRR